MLLNPSTYPTIHKATMLLLNDTGATCKKLEIQMATENFNLYKIEETLGNLGEELEEFCNGDEDTQIEIASRDQGLMECSDFLDALRESIGELHGQCNQS